MTTITLYSGPLSMFGAKVQIALQEKGIAFDLQMVPFDMKTLYEPKHPAVLRINPKRQVPVLIHGDLELYDSTQIFEYLEDLKPEAPLWPREIAARARARRLEHESDEVYFPPVIRLMGLQQIPDDPSAVTARAACAAYYARIEGLLADGRPWLNGADYTYADIAFFMAQIFGDRMGAPIDAGFAPLLAAWRSRMTGRAAVRAVAGAMARWLLTQHRPLPGFMMDLLDRAA
jgi:glutathione S-transferase